MWLRYTRIPSLWANLKAGTKSLTCTAAAGDGEADAPGGAALGSVGSAGSVAGTDGAPAALDDDKGEGRRAPEPPKDPDTPPGGDGGGEHEGTETLDLFPEERPAWRADTGIRHVSLENLVAVLGERFLSVMPKSVITEGEQPAWEDVVHAARDLAPLLGIGERLLWRAAGLMGWRAVAVCIALIDRRSQDGAADPVLNAGGYFRGCVEKGPARGTAPSRQRLRGARPTRHGERTMRAPGAGGGDRSSDERLAGRGANWDRGLLGNGEGSPRGNGDYGSGVEALLLPYRLSFGVTWGISNEMVSFKIFSRGLYICSWVHIWRSLDRIRFNLAH